LVGCSSHYILYIDETSFCTTAQSEPLPVDHECYGAADVRRVGYGLEVGRSRWGGSILCRHMHSWLILLYTWLS